MNLWGFYVFCIALGIALGIGIGFVLLGVGL